ncbi:MAG: NADH-quinone oxidoreductase subunit C [Acidobacteria bacterium]|nr:MAG: NADH-quinone oxidoreductase subunit C [Acidobacteriota bacterium]
MPAASVDRNHLVAVCDVLRTHPDLRFELLLDVTAVDRLPASPRYEIVYLLACLGAAFGSAPARRLRLTVRLDADSASVPTVSGVWPSANWAEREVFDLFGIQFEGHPDLRRVLMPDDWEGHPLRKDYPVQIRKDTASWSPIQLTEEQFTANMRAAREHATRAARSIRGEKQ